MLNMNALPLISVIVPIYNVKPYLAKCVKSIFAQSYRDIEILLVDDGSTDGSGALADELAAEDVRATVFHKENGGLSDARNFGLAHCNGEWVSFVDSDDYVSPIYIETLYIAASENGCDIAAIPFGKPFTDGDSCDLVNSSQMVPPPRLLASSSVQRLMLYQAMDTGAPWRLYKKTLLGVDPFPVGLYYEDLATVYRVIRRTEKVAILDCRGLYAYRIRSNSIIRQEYRHIKGVSALVIADSLYTEICAWYPGLERAAASRCFSLCRMVFAQVPARSPSLDNYLDREALWSVLKKHRKTVLLDSDARKRERLSALIALFGPSAFRFYCGVCRRLGLMR